MKRIKQLGPVLCVVALLAGLAIGLYSQQSVVANAQRRAFADVYAALAYYIEDHRAFPNSPDDLAGAGIIQTQQDGAFVVAERSSSAFAPSTYGERIDGWDVFTIAWGTDLEQLTADEQGHVTDASGNPVMLLRSNRGWPTTDYSDALMTVYQGAKLTD